MLRGGVGLAFHTPRLLQNGDVVYALSKDRHLISTTLGERSDWIPRSYGPALPEKRNSFLRLLKNKGFREESMTKVGLYAISKSTTLESNKSLSQIPPFLGEALTECLKSCVRIPLLSKNSLLKPTLLHDNVTMSFRRQTPGLSATSTSLQG